MSNELKNAEESEKVLMEKVVKIADDICMAVYPAIEELRLAIVQINDRIIALEATLPPKKKA